MSWLSSFFVGVLTGIVGMAVSAFIANQAISWYRIPNFEAASAAFAVSMTVLGGMVAFAIGIITCRVMPNPAFLKALGSANGVVIVLAVIVGGTARLLADVPPEIDGETLMLAVQLRWPASQTTSPVDLPGEPALVLGSVTRTSNTQRASSRGPLWTSDAKLVDGRWVAPGAVEIFTTRGKFVLSAMLDSVKNPGFLMPLSGAPKRKDLEWTEWYPHARPGAPPLPDGFQYRYRVQKRSDPVRTETIGPFDVQTIAQYFFNDMLDGKNVIATMGRFAITYRGKPVTVESKSPDIEAGVKIDRADGVAVIAGPTAALLAHFGNNDDGTGCYVLADEKGQLRLANVPECHVAEGSILTTDTTAFRNGARKVARGRINRFAFELPGLYVVGKGIVDTRNVTVHPLKAPDDFASFPNVPPLGISPDQRSFVRLGSHYDGENRTVLAVTDFVGNHSYLLPVDESRMRYATYEAIDPAWLLHHFEWKKGPDGVDALVERKGFTPLPYHSRFVGVSGYNFEPGREPLRDALIQFIVKEFKGVVVPVDSTAYVHPVTIGPDTVQVAYNDTGHYVSLSLPGYDHVKPTPLLESIAQRFDVELATGKYDAMFGK